MFSDDYILRIIRQATAVFAKIIGLQKAGQYAEAIQVIDSTLEQLLGMNAEIIDMMDDESLYTLLTKEDVLDLERLEFIAELFKEKGDIQRQRNLPGESIDCYARSLNYYLIIGINEKSSRAGELAQKIEELLQKLGSTGLQEQTLLNLYSYYENSKEYAKADDMLGKLAARNPSAAYITEEMSSFYHRLLAKSPEELTQGGISRSQIQDKWKKLEISQK